MKNNVKPNTKDLLSHLAYVMTELKSKKITVDDAKAHASLVKQSNNLLKFELDRAKAIAKHENIDLREIETF